MTKPINGIDLGYNRLSPQQKITAEKTNQTGNLTKITDQAVKIDRPKTADINNISLTNPAFTKTDVANVQNNIISEQKAEINNRLNSLKGNHNSLRGINGIINQSSQLNLTNLVSKFSQAVSEFQKNGSNVNYQQIIMASDKLQKGCTKFIEQFTALKEIALVNQQTIDSFSNNINLISKMPSEIISENKPVKELILKHNEIVSSLNSQLNSSSIAITNNELILAQLNSQNSIEPKVTTKEMINELFASHQACETAETTNRMIDEITSSMVKTLG